MQFTVRNSSGGVVFRADLQSWGEWSRVGRTCEFRSPYEFDAARSRFYGLTVEDYLSGEPLGGVEEVTLRQLTEQDFRHDFRLHTH